MNNIGLGLTQSQKLVISPQLQNAIKLLQLSSIELIEKIETELSENPFLEETYEQVDDKKENSDNDRKSKEKDSLVKDVKNKENNNDRSTEESFFEDSSDSGYLKKNSGSSDANSKQQFLENAFAVETSIFDHLLSQLRLLNITDLQYHIGEIIISSLDENGYFKIPIDEITIEINAEKEDVLKVLNLIQNLDPPGIGARDLQESLLIQMDQLENSNDLAYNIIKENIHFLEKRKYKELASYYKTSYDEIKKAAEFISSLEPMPARRFDTKKIKYIVPDVAVEKIEEGFIISINDTNIPSVKLNSDYRSYLQNEKMEEKTKNFFDEKYSEAKLLIFSLEKRKSTIRKVVEQLVEYQKDFFGKGPQYIKPLILKDIAEKIEMHESTVSRVTSNKYMETPWGIFPLKYFFSSAIRKESGELKSSRSIKEIIKEIIENESCEQTLSDDKIVKILSNRGIKIARRTVAKYRKSLQIQSSFDRKKV